METQVTVKKVNTPKVLDSGYVVKVLTINGETSAFPKVGSLKEARDLVRGISSPVKAVEIYRQNTTETLINTFQSKTETVVSLIQVDDLSLE